MTIRACFLSLIFFLFLGCHDPSPRELAPIVESAEPVVSEVARPDFGTLAIRVHGAQVHRLQTARLEDGSTRRRLVVTSLSGAPLWTYPEEGAPTSDEFLDDVAVHPSGDVTVTLEHLDAARDAYELVRFAPNGEVLGRQWLPAGALVPDSDLGTLPRPPFRMRSTWNDDALAEGWVRVVADGEDAVVEFQTEVDEPGGAFTFDVVSAVSWLDWDGAAYSETRTRVVDGSHRIGPVAWTYDEFRWRQAAVRPYLAIDPVTHVVVAGRAWSNLRCRVAVEVFAEGTLAGCVFDSVSAVEVERVPFAWTSFAPDGTRLGTRVFMPASTREVATFDMIARDGLVALVGSRVNEEPDGSVTYYDGNLVPYDSYLAVLDRETGALVFDRNVDASGRGDLLSAARFVRDGIVAVGGADWDRWNGGMSISRGADPFVVHVSMDGVVTQRRIAAPDDARHTHLLGVDVAEGSHAMIFAAGLSDAPMTHSGDGGQTAQMTFGDVLLTLGAR